LARVRGKRVMSFSVGTSWPLWVSRHPACLTAGGVSFFPARDHAARIP
jgi:hypothetical protein